MSRLKFNGESISSVSLNSSQEIVAVGCGSQVEVMRLYNANVDYSVMQLKSSGRFTITDVAFSPTSDSNIAASATNGMVAVFDVSHFNSRPTGHTRWDSSEAPRSINKVGWHPTENNLLISAGMDGIVRRFDLRDKSRKGTWYNTKTEATRDVQYNPFDTSMFAAISENGVLSIWDQRNNDIPLSKINAHTMSGLSVAWNPSFCGIIATGSRDKSVKIWDLGHTASSNSNRSVISGNSLGLDTANNEDLTNKLGHRPVQVILTPSSVGRIRWRKTDKFADQLGTVSTGADTQSGEILIWNVNNPNMPRCALKAHGVEACSDFVWLDTPLNRDSEDNDADDGRSESMGIYQHILSVGKDGSMLVQDLRNSFFPRSHISPSVTAISSQGHLAFQRSIVDRGDPLGLVSNKDTRNAPLILRDQPEAFGLSNVPSAISRPDPTIGGKDRNGRKLQGDYRISSARGSSDEINSKGGAKAANDVNGGALSSFTQDGNNTGGTGIVYCGLANISNLVEAQEIRGVRGAEGGVFDPAVVALLARTYKLGSGGGYADAQDACERNLNVAQESGLKCRASVWSTVLSLLTENHQDEVPMFVAEGQHEKSHINPPRHASGTSKDINLPSKLPFSVEILGFLLQELLDGGDCQHFVVLCEVLKCANLLEEACRVSEITVLQRREAYLAYFDLLGRLKLFCSANDIIKGSNEDYISKITRHGVVMHTSCAKCGKELTDTVGSPWCAKCNHCASSCSLCHKPVLKMMQWCPVCGHGGHRECLDIWYSKNSTCPTGCGHKCCQGRAGTI
jgi:hypothetical protein